MSAQLFTKETKNLLKEELPIIQQNLTTWKFGGIGFLIGFAPIQEAAFAGYMKLFWQDINEYLESKRPGRCVLGRNDDTIDRISPHCVVGQCTAEGLGDWFYKSSTQASSNYGIDKNGRVSMYCEEKNRSWCTSRRWAHCLRSISRN